MSELTDKVCELLNLVRESETEERKAAYAKGERCVVPIRYAADAVRKLINEPDDIETVVRTVIAAAKGGSPVHLRELSEFHERDVEYFTEYSAPIMQLLHSYHSAPLNATISFFGPMLYFLARALGVEQVLEIGHAEGYTSFYLANAVKDNAVRYGMAGNRFYAIDIIQTENVREMLAKYNLPVTILQLDSMKLTPQTFPGITFDLIFQDGCHDADHVLYEMKTMYPQLKGEGKGFWIAHDCYGPAEKGFREIERLIKAGVYEFEFVRIPEIYGIAIMRKMKGHDPNKQYWPEWR